MASTHAKEVLLKKFRDYVSTANEPREHTHVSMGPLALNMLFGDYRGIHSGRIVQITGKPSNGKTTLALDILAQFLHNNPEEMALFVDFERTFDGDYAKACGVDTERLLVVRPDYAEQGLEILEKFIHEGVCRLAVVDSVPAALPKDEVSKDFTDRQKMASSAGIITRFCQRSVGLLDNKDATVILVNQMRKNFSTMSMEEEVPFGGLALQYASSVVIHVQKIGTEEDCIVVRATVKKSKVHRPMGRAEFKIVYGSGIDHEMAMLQLAIDCGVVTKSGSWYRYGAHYSAQGEQKAVLLFPLEEITARVVLALQENSDMLNEKEEKEAV